MSITCKKFSDKHSSAGLSNIDRDLGNPDRAVPDVDPDSRTLDAPQRRSDPRPAESVAAGLYRYSRRHNRVLRLFQGGPSRPRAFAGLPHPRNLVMVLNAVHCRSNRHQVQEVEDVLRGAQLPAQKGDWMLQHRRLGDCYQFISPGLFSLSTRAFLELE